MYVYSLVVVLFICNEIHSHFRNFLVLKSVFDKGENVSIFTCTHPVPNLFDSSGSTYKLSVFPTTYFCFLLWRIFINILRVLTCTN